MVSKWDCAAQARVARCIGYYKWGNLIRYIHGTLPECPKSESDRLKLEEKFDTLLRSCKSHKAMQLFQLKENYRQLLEQDRLRCDRNDYILQSLERLENRTYALNARTDRLRLLKNHYEAYIDSHYQEWKREENKNSSSLEPTSHYFCSSNLQNTNLSSTCHPLSRTPSLNSPRTLSLSRKGSLIIPDTELLPSQKYTSSPGLSDSYPLVRKKLLGSTPSLNITKAHNVVSHKSDYISNEKISPIPKLSANDGYFQSSKSCTQEQSSIGETWHTVKAINADKLYSTDKFDNLNKSNLSLVFSTCSTKSGRPRPTLSQSVDSIWSIRKPFKSSKPLTRSKSFTSLSSYSYKSEPVYSSETKFGMRTYHSSVPNKHLSRYSSKSSVSSLATRSRPMSPLRVVDDIFKKYLINYDKRYLSDPISESKYGKYLYPPKNACADLNISPVDVPPSECDSKFNNIIPTFRTHSPSRTSALTNYSLFDNNEIFTSSESKHRIPESDRHLLHSSSVSNWKDWSHYRDRYEYQFQFGGDNYYSDNFKYKSNRDFREEDRMKYDFTETMGNHGSGFASPHYSESFKSYQHAFDYERSKPSVQSVLEIQSARYSQACPKKPIISKKIELDYRFRESLKSPQTPKRVSFSNECLYLDKSDTDASQSHDEVPFSNYECDYLLDQKSWDYQDTETEEVNLTDTSIKTPNNLVVTEGSQVNSLDNICYNIKPDVVDKNKKCTSDPTGAIQCISDSFSESSDYNIKNNEKRRASLFPNNDLKLNANSFEIADSEKDAEKSGGIDIITSKPMKEVEKKKNSLEELGKPLDSLPVGSLESNTDRVYNVDNKVLMSSISKDNVKARTDFTTELQNIDDLPHLPADLSNLNTVDETAKSVPISANAKDVQHDSSPVINVVDDSLKQNKAELGNEIYSQTLSNKDLESDQKDFKSTEHSEEKVEKISEYPEEKTLMNNLETQPEYENSNTVLQEQYDHQVNQGGIVHDSSNIPEKETDYRNIGYHQEQLPEQYSDEKYKEESVTDIEQSNDVPVYNSEQLGTIAKSYEQQPEADYQHQPGDYDGYVQEEYQHQQFKSDDSGQQELYEQQNYEGEVKEEYLPHQQDPLNQEFSAVQYGDEYPQEYSQQPIQYQEDYRDQRQDLQAVTEQYPTDYAPSYQNDPLYQAQPQDSQIIQDQFRSDYETNYQNETQYQDPNLANPTNTQEQYEADLNTAYEGDLQYQGQLQEPQNMPDQYVGDYTNSYQEPQFQGELQSLPNNQEQLGGEYDSTYQKDPPYQYEQEGTFEQTNIPEQYGQYDQQISEPYDKQYQRQPEQFSNYDYGYNGQGEGTDQTFMEEPQPYNTTLQTEYGDTSQMQNEDVMQHYTDDQGTVEDNPQPYEDIDYETQNNPSHNENPVIENQLQTNSDPVVNFVDPTSYSPTPAPNPSGTTPNINRVLESDSESILAKEGVPQEDSSDFDFSSEHK